MKSLYDLCVQNNVTTIAIRPYTVIRSVSESDGFNALSSFHDLINNPHKYSYKAIRHQIVSKAYFLGCLGAVMLLHNFIKLGIYFLLIRFSRSWIMLPRLMFCSLGLRPPMNQMKNFRLNQKTSILRDTKTFRII